jgi:hypothetical protein
VVVIVVVVVVVLVLVLVLAVVVCVVVVVVSASRPQHYILNNQETHRSGVNELIDEKTLMELYGPPFAAAAQYTAGYMCA